MSTKIQKIKKVVKENLSSDRFSIIGNVVVIQGRAEKILRALGHRVGRFADAVINDPPYETTSCSWDVLIPFDVYWKRVNACSELSAPQVIFGSQPFTSALLMSNLKNFRYELVWDKQKCGSPGLAKKRPMKIHENMIVFSQSSSHFYNPIMEEGEPYSRKAPTRGLNQHGYGLKPQAIENKGTRYPQSIRRVRRNFSAQQQLHPTQKPVPLLEWLIETYSPKRGLVLDLTCGSGSLGVAALNTGRSAVIIENDKIFFKMACDWCQAVYSGSDWNPTAYRKSVLGA